MNDSNKGIPPLLFKILDKARWAPSGDNLQPWHVKVLSNNQFMLHLNRIERNVYNLLPFPDLISLGMFLEIARMAAEELEHDLVWSMEEDHQHILVTLNKKEHSLKDPLLDFVVTRSVNRFRYRLKQTPQDVKARLEQEMGKYLKLYWFESFSDRWCIGNILAKAMDMRFCLPEAYPVHASLIDWSGKNVKQGISSASIGVDKLTQLLMRTALQNKKVSDVLVSIPGSTLGVQLQSEFLPALMCSGHFMIAFNREQTPNPRPDDYVRAGMVLQRFWLILTAKQMVMHPWYAPVIFSNYLEKGIDFTSSASCLKKTQRFYQTFSRNILKPNDITLGHVVFAGRVGFPVKTDIPRSIRKEVEEIVVSA